MLCENSDEPYCEELAKAITDEIRRGNHIDTTTKLRQVIEKTLDFLPEKEKKETISKQTVEIADKVVDKQMRIVQEIASLLGETAAETKIALTKLKESISDE
mgnify:FL=1